MTRPSTNLQLNVGSTTGPRRSGCSSSSGTQPCCPLRQALCNGTCPHSPVESEIRYSLRPSVPWRLDESPHAALDYWKGPDALSAFITLLAASGSHGAVDPRPEAAPPFASTAAGSPREEFSTSPPTFSTRVVIDTTPNRPGVSSVTSARSNHQPSSTAEQCPDNHVGRPTRPVNTGDRGGLGVRPLHPHARGANRLRYCRILSGSAGGRGRTLHSGYPPLTAWSTSHSQQRILPGLERYCEAAPAMKAVTM